MSTPLVDALVARFGADAVKVAQPRGEVTLEVAPTAWLETASALRDDFGFDTFIDLCGVDYLGYGNDEWDSTEASWHGFGRGAEGYGPGRFNWGEEPSHQSTGGDGIAPDQRPTRRFAVVMQLLSIRHNQRLTLRCFAPDDGLPVVPSVTGIWRGADWFERGTESATRGERVALLLFPALAALMRPEGVIACLLAACALAMRPRGGWRAVALLSLAGPLLPPLFNRALTGQSTSTTALVPRPEMTISADIRIGIDRITRSIRKANTRLVSTPRNSSGCSHGS